MGVDSEMPYLYDGPSHRKIAFPYSQSEFNPKAVTEASYARLSQQSLPAKPKQNGPLINFNQHPDSYVVFSGAQKDFKPLPPKTKQAVVGVRWAQFGMRVVQEIVALGLLVGTICTRGTEGAETYLLRIPQALDSLITLYAIYHLLRAAKGRTPASSASYHAFALIMDTALIPLYVYIVLLLSNNRQLPVPQYGASGDILDGNWRFTSVFTTQNRTDLLLLVTFLGAAVIAGLHLLSIGLDLYLVIAFRKITALPPDMNPLEDNLTSRRTTKHKYKNSELTLNSNASDEKMAKHMSTSTTTFSVGNNSRLSVAEKSVHDGEGSLPFGQSRDGSKASLAFSPHNPESARLSRHQYDGQQEVYQAAATSPRRSRYEIRPDGKLKVRSRRGSQSPSKRGSVVVESVNVSSTDLTMKTEKDLPTIPADEIGRALSPDLAHAAVQHRVAQQEQSSKLLNDNWYVLDAEEDDLSRGPTPAPPTSRFAVGAKAGGYMPVHDRHDSFESQDVQQSARQHARDETLYSYEPNMMPKPLGMHPPTPPQTTTQFPHAADVDEHVDRYGEGVDRAPTNASNGAASSVYSESAPSLKSSKGSGGPGTPKGKYYGDLAAATRGVRGAESPRPLQSHDYRHSVTGANVYGGCGLLPSAQPSHTPSPEKQARVISRTSADIADESVLYLHPQENNSKYSMRSRRDVSGKVAEEGRGGGSWGRRG